MSSTKKALDISEEEYFADKKRSKDQKKRLLAPLESYRNWLLQLTILDPACGSGAFLNEALNFLIAEHAYIDELQAKLFGDSLILSDVENTILEKNLFGVDLNEKSIEIAKLSLWLRTARPGRKLNHLNNNLKCGNSLIDSPLVAGNKAFDWKKEFSHIFENGGFDVVIGNPPYVFARDNFTKQGKKIYINQYISAKYQINTYLLFIEKAVHLLKTNGIYGLIIPNTWLMVYSGEGLRRYLLDNCKLNQINNLAEYAIYDSKVIYVLNYLLMKNYDEKTQFSPIPEGRNNDFIAFNIEAIINFAYKKRADLWIDKQDAYFKYCKLMKEIAKFVYNEEDKPYKAEMLLLGYFKEAVRDMKQHITIQID